MPEYAVMTKLGDDWVYVCEDTEVGYKTKPVSFEDRGQAEVFANTLSDSRVVEYKNNQDINLKSIEGGGVAENEFANLRRDTFMYFANREQNILEHWDLMDSELGRIDVKAPKRKHRGGDIDFHIWWELKTVKRPPNWQSSPGWGVPNGIDRLIAIRHTDAYYLIKPEDIIEDLRQRCRDYSRKPFGLHARPDRGDLMTTLPIEYVQEHARHKLDVHD